MQSLALSTLKSPADFFFWKHLHKRNLESTVFGVMSALQRAKCGKNCHTTNKFLEMDLPFERCREKVQLDIAFLNIDLSNNQILTTSIQANPFGLKDQLSTIGRLIVML